MDVDLKKIISESINEFFRINEIRIDTHHDLFILRGQELFDRIMNTPLRNRRDAINNLNDDDKKLFFNYYAEIKKKEAKDPENDPYDQMFNPNDYIWNEWEDWPPHVEHDPEAKDAYRLEYWETLSPKERTAIRKRSRKMGKDIYFNLRHKEMFSKREKNLNQMDLPFISSKNN